MVVTTTVAVVVHDEYSERSSSGNYYYFTMIMLLKTQKCVCWNVGQSVDAGVLSNVLVKGIQSVLRGESASTKELLLLLSQGKAVLYCCFRLH